MTNLDSILNSRDITLPTKVCLVKAMVFPVVMYGCESWTIKKSEHQKIDAFELSQSFANFSKVVHFNLIVYSHGCYDTGGIKKFYLTF